MARYVVDIRTDLPAEEAFAYMADLRNFAEWDPGVTSSKMVEGVEPDRGTAYDVEVKAISGTMTLRYRTTEFDPPRRLVAEAASDRLTSVDEIRVRSDGDGSVVTYDAELTLNGVLGAADPLLGLAFQRIGDRAADGMASALAGERIDRVGSGGGAIASTIDGVLEGPVVPSFTRIGYSARRKLDDWTDLADYDMSGRVALVTGSTSGLGHAAAKQLADRGAAVIVVGRDSDRNQSAVADLVAETGNTEIAQVAADLGDLDQVRHLADGVLADYDRLDVLLHNAGALSNERKLAPDGTEATVASQVVGPFLLTSLLLGRLSESAPARVLTMSSGGMYTSGLTVSKLEMPPDEYKGAEQYARAKRAQVTLNEMWAERHGDDGVHFHAAHPGWADTPGVDDSLPLFSKIMGPLLRSPDQGADTITWLAMDDVAVETNGLFWHDRRPRSIHKLPTTRTTDTAARREALWAWVSEKAL